MTDTPLTDWFHRAALAVGFVAAAEGWLGDSERVKRAVYALHETGGWPGGRPAGRPLAFPGGLGQDAPTHPPEPRTEDV